MHSSSRLFTAGDDFTTIGHFLAGRSSSSAADVVEYVLGGDACHED